MSKKRILIFAVAYHPFVGGAEIAVKEITDRIPEIEFHMLTVNLDGKQKREEQIGNILVHRIGSGTLGKFLFPMRGFSLAKRLHRQHRYAAFWSIMANQSSVAAAFTKKAFPDMPLVLTVQEGDEESHLKRYALGSDLLYRILVRPWHTLVFKRANIITAISAYLAERSAKINPHIPALVIPNGVDLAHFAKHPSAAEIDATNKEIGKSPDNKFLITVSRLAAKNAVGDIVEALKFLPDYVKLLIVGAGELEATTRAQIATLGLQRRVILLGHKAHREIPKYLAASDIFIRPSISEGMGNSFIEAMAAGIPVIATPVGGIVDFLTDGETGLVCEPRNPRSIADKVSRLLDDEALCKTLVANARALATARYDWDQIAERFRREVFA